MTRDIESPTVSDNRKSFATCRRDTPRIPLGDRSYDEKQCDVLAVKIHFPP